MPNLAGQKADNLVAQLLAFKHGDRKNDFMSVVADQLSEAEIHGYARFWSIQPAANSSVQAIKAQPAIPSRTSMPTDFPAHYTIYETINDTAASVVTKRFANAVAIRAARAGQPLPDGSIIVVANYAAQPDAAGGVKDGAVRSYAVMESRAGWGVSVPALLKNGNWDYAVFNANRVRNDELNQALCLACHKPAAGDSYVFTLKALRAAATRPVG